MKTLFIGVISISWHSLKALLECEANVVGIFTADKQGMLKKTGMHPDYFSKFNDLALEYKVPLYELSHVNAPLDIEQIKRLEPDIIFCIGWPQIVRKEILQIPLYGCIGMHPTLLPKRRGGAPINWCLIDGLNKSGVTLFYLEEGLDSGDIIAQKEFEITFEDNAKTILNKVTDITVELIKEYYPLLEQGKAPRIPQDDTKATYTKRRRPEDGIIDWSRTSLSNYNWIRALTLPFPGAFTLWEGRKVIIWESELLEGYRLRFNAKPGEILDTFDKRGVIVASGDSCILIKTVEVQGQRMSGDEFVKRVGITTGTILGGK